MKIPFRTAVVLAAVLLAVSAATAQFGMRQPSLSGIFAPVVGEGAAYLLTSPNEKTVQMEITITGKEEYQGKPGYWEEVSFSGTPQGTMTVKSLMTVEGNQVVNLRTVMRMGADVVEMDNSMPMMQNRQKPETADMRKSATRVGTETITVPAGTFTCEHWRMNDGSSDAWVSDKVHPWGVVKVTGKERNMILQRVITDATTKLPPPYKKLDMQELMRKAQQRP